MYAGEAQDALDLALRLDRCARPDGGVEEFWRCLQLGTALFLNGRGIEGAPLVHRAIELVQTVDVLRDDPRHLGSAAMAPSWVNEPQVGRALADRAIARARELGAFNSLPTSLKFGAWADFDLGRWDAALAGASEAIEIARGIGQRSQLCANLGIVAAVLAGRGDEPGCLAAVSEALEVAEELELEWHRSSFFGWRGLLELGVGRVEEAVSSLLQAVTLLERLGNLSADEDPFVNLIEAQVRAGLLEDAHTKLETYEAMAAAEALPVGLARASRLRGLLAGEGEYSLHFERALDLLGDGEPFTVARTHLCFGERLRRSGERRRARTELEAALELFERLGARPWVERCRQELVASGRRLRRIDASSREELTPQELQVALQVARGLTNREIAQALFLSPKTVEFHLTRIYRKLDLNARAELVERFADQVERER
jgi:DNA-binding CsgD family transcriptional regulator